MKASKLPKRSTDTAVLPAAPIRNSWWPWAAALAAIAGAFIVYGPALGGPFLLDDTYLPYVQAQSQQIPFGGWIRGVRPVLMVSYWLNYESSGENTGSYHLVNLLLHILNAGLIFLIIRRLLDWSQVESRTREILAAFAAAVFLLHPLQTESVSYIAGRSETLSVFFFLAAFAVFVYRRSAAVSWPVAAGVLVLFGAACLTKEHVAVFPLLLLLTDYYWNPGYSTEGIRKNWRLYIPLIAGGAVALVFIWRLLSSATSAGFGLKDFTWYQYFFTECRAIWRYLLFYIFPFGQNIDHDFVPSKTIVEHGAVFGLACLIALMAAAWIYRKRWPLASYGVFVLLLLLAPTSSIIPIRDTLVERRLYLPFIGILLITVGLLRYWKTSRTTLVTALGIILLTEAGLTYARNQLWGNAIDLWADSVSKSPAKMRPHFQLAYAYYNAGQCGQAVSEFEKTSHLEKPDFGLLVDWGLAADCAGNSGEALAKLRQAAELNKTGHIYSQIGMEYAKMGQYPQALDALETAAHLDPGFGRTYVYRGNVYALQGNKQRAAEEYQKALQIDPGDQYARDGLMKLARQ